MDQNPETPCVCKTDESLTTSCNPIRQLLNFVGISYEGNQLFAGIARKYHMPIDHINFVASQLLAGILAIIFGVYIRPRPDNYEKRLWYLLVFGFFIAVVTFGPQTFHLILLPSICYIPMKFMKSKLMPCYVLTIAMFYLSLVHIHRLWYGAVSLDITGPMMVMTQKITSLAYCIQDGSLQSQDSLTNTQKYYAIKEVPVLLEYFSYIFQFQTLMAGPFILFKDFKEFITGRNFKKYEYVMLKDLKDPGLYCEPSPFIPAMQKLIVSVICALVFILVTCPIERLKDEDFLAKGIPYQMCYIILATSLVRFKYYHAWILADAICNLSGLGFNGYDPITKKAKWDLTSNVDIYNFELGTNIRESIDSWNKGTNLWLKLIVYSRVKKYNVLLTYLLSALWHGFYPGYYMTFLSGALFTVAARVVRGSLRPYFQTSQSKIMFYNVLTIFVTRIIMGYLTFSFVLLEFWASLLVFWHMYFFLHILAVLSIVFLPRLLGPTEAPLRNRLTKLVANSNGVNSLHG
ncbi:lysophospholipid acyltransferase 1 isoform X1 [Cimex lectularius]|uniref:Uncharacterized protein n=1 Tax=Cimex lectularius TaxID=79782 RepID=A0A8I6SKM3_CIMLE|nr:lysophospholipid acyltransferase 1 isoform X1 [Cimex lectularius]